MIIGDKNKFGIEYEISPDHLQMGFGRIWIENDFIGTFEDLIYLNGYLLGTLGEFKRAKELSTEIKHLNKEDLFDLFMSGNYEYADRYLVRGSTFTDDFAIWCYKENDLIFVLWKVIRNDFFKDLENYTREVLLKPIDQQTFETVLRELEASYHDNGIKV